MSWRVTVRLFDREERLIWEAPLGLSRSEAGDWARDILWPHHDTVPLGTVVAILPAGDRVERIADRVSHARAAQTAERLLTK